ncbi:hypothetical protein BpHYR1_030402 [Brachionus plicatilis]|uniref:Uncharacterized protein n=1 Tax=Brachionus plicatilis TaxID=10195 RepID=A0A3M7T2R8_BRAPC|nr:hypothetical protein BpHYR1_030402 [Brachionus plicatilis]
MPKYLNFFTSNRVTIFFFYFEPILFRNFKNANPIFPKFLNNPFSSAVKYGRLKRVKRVNPATPIIILNLTIEWWGITQYSRFTITLTYYIEYIY